MQKTSIQNVVSIFVLLWCSAIWCISVPARMSPTITGVWEELLAQHREIMGKEVYDLLTRQQSAFVQGTDPTIAAECITCIEIVECGEELININDAQHPRIKMKQYPNDSKRRTKNRPWVRKKVFEALKQMIDELDRLAPTFGYAPGEINIVVLEGLRDLETQKLIFDSVSHRLRAEHPTWNKDKIVAETSKFVSPYKNNIPVHSTGAAVDIRLWNNKRGALCKMGDMTVDATAPIFTVSAELSITHYKNRLLFMIAAARAGLTVYLREFWHLSLGDRYAAFWNICSTTSAARVQHEKAKYGIPVNPI